MNSQALKNVLHSVLVTGGTAAVVAAEKLISSGFPVSKAAAIADVKVIAGAAVAALCAYALKLLSVGSSAA